MGRSNERPAGRGWLDGIFTDSLEIGMALIYAAALFSVLV